jgi:hypothetical protein
MDVEGAEEDVLKGGQSLLRSARPVLIIELHHTYESVLEAFAGLDYVVMPLTREKDLSRTDGEFQILAYPAGHAAALAFRAEIEAGDTRAFE